MTHLTNKCKLYDMCYKCILLIILVTIHSHASTSDGYLELYAGDEPYLQKCTQNPSILIVWLHTWSADYLQVRGELHLNTINNACIVSPNFNGPSGISPNTCNSKDAIERIARVIRKAQYELVPTNTIIVGVSGGGAAGLVFLAKYPYLVQAATIWVPIYDFESWYNENREHRKELETCFGSAPLLNDADYLRQSPKGVMDKFQSTKVIINGAAFDSETLPIHAKDAAEHIMRVCKNCLVRYQEWNLGHDYDREAQVEQIEELINLIK